MINLGLIGFGYWGPNYARVISTMKHVKLKWICDLDNKLLLKAKSLYPQIRLTTSYLQLLQDIEVNAVIVATPVTTHYQLAKESLINNKHVLVEKPLATSYKAATDLQTLSLKVNKVVFTGHIYLFHPAVKFLKQCIDKGDLGKTLFITSQRTNLGPIRNDVNVAWDLASHDISTIKYLLNKKIISISANGQGFIDRKKEDIVDINLKLDTGIFVNIFISWLSPIKVRQMSIVGRKKIVVFDDNNRKNPIKLINQHPFSYQQGTVVKYQQIKDFFMKQKFSKPSIFIEEPLKLQMIDFVKLISNQSREWQGNLSHAVEVVKILELIDKSLKTNKQIFYQ